MPGEGWETRVVLVWIHPRASSVGIHLKPWQHFVPCSLTLGAWLGLVSTHMVHQTRGQR